MSLSAKKENTGYTYRDYKSWSDYERWELISGIAYDMSPAPSRRHQEVCLELARQISNYLVGKTCKVYIAPFDVRLPEGKQIDEDIHNVVQPDITVVCDSAKLDDKGCIGVPDLIMEILSPYTSGKDMKEKLNLYERSGVKEYWIVHPTDKIAMVFKLGLDGFYGRPYVYTQDDTVKVCIFEDLFIMLKLVFAE